MPKRAHLPPAAIRVADDAGLSTDSHPYAWPVEIHEESDGGFALEFFDEVRVSVASDSQLAGRLGAVLGRTKDETNGAQSYAVAIDDEARTWMLPLCHLARTGRRRSRKDYYPG